MQIAKWGNSLAVRLPRRIVEALELKTGDEVDIVEIGQNGFQVKKSDRKAAFLAEMQSFKIELPKDYAFDRGEANER